MKASLWILTAFALLVLLIPAIVLIASLQGWPGGMYHIDRSTTPDLEVGEDIIAWSEFNKDSYHMGDLATASIRVWYRNAAVTPDFETFTNYLTFQPFEQLDMKTTIRTPADGITDYQIEYRLRAMGNRISGSYKFDPATLYYTKNTDPDATIHTLQIARPFIHIASYYPSDIRGIELLPLKEKLTGPVNLQRGILITAASILFILSLFLLWVCGRHRTTIELTIPERLLREFNDFRNIRMENRAYLLKCEKVFSGLLSGYAGVSPEKFWAGLNVDCGPVTAITERARNILRRLYQFTGPRDADVKEMTLLLEETLSGIVDAERLSIEQEPGYVDRLRKQPKVVVFSASLLIISIILLILSVSPVSWMPADINIYNQAVAGLQNGVVIGENPYDELTELAEKSSLDKVRAAASYNSGTIRANQSFATAWLSQDEQRYQHNLVLAEILRPQSAETFLHNLTGSFFHTEEEIVVTLTNGAEHLLRAMLHLQAAVRTRTADEEINRNLELVIKRRWYLLSRLAQIRDYYQAVDADREEDEPLSETGLVDIINSKLPDDFDNKEVRNDDRGYIIFERF